MVVTHWLRMDLSTYEGRQRIAVPKWDLYTRQIGMRLFSGVNPWIIPEDVSVVICYRKADGTKGEYDTLPNGEKAWSVSGNSLQFTLAPQVLSAEGAVVLHARLMQGEKMLSTFGVELLVSVPGNDLLCGEKIESEDYRLITGILPAPAQAEVGQFVRILDVDAGGKVMQVEAVDLPSGEGFGVQIVNIRVQEVE